MILQSLINTKISDKEYFLHFYIPSTEYQINGYKINSQEFFYSYHSESSLLIAMCLFYIISNDFSVFKYKNRFNIFYEIKIKKTFQIKIKYTDWVSFQAICRKSLSTLFSAFILSFLKQIITLDRSAKNSEQIGTVNSLSLTRFLKTFNAI